VGLFVGVFFTAEASPCRRVAMPRTQVCLSVQLAGDNDIVSMCSDYDSIRWYENNGTGNFTMHVVNTAWEQTYCVAAADLDGDGDTDIISTHPYNSRILW
jgi:hypothetical protein